MEKDQNQPSKSGVEKNVSPEQGREPGNTQQTATHPNTDISQIDQQEGDMNHGELGGNLKSDDSLSGTKEA